MTVLNRLDSQRFIDTYQRVAIALSTLNGNPKPPGPPVLLAQAQEQLQDAPELLDQAVTQLNQRGLQTDPEVIEGLRRLHRGE